MDEIPTFTQEFAQPAAVVKEVYAAGEVPWKAAHIAGLVGAPLEVFVAEVTMKARGAGGRDFPVASSRASELAGQPPVEADDIRMRNRQDTEGTRQAGADYIPARSYRFGISPRGSYGRRMGARGIDA